MTARYIAPVSRNAKPSCLASNRATVLLPAPEGPSMATTSGGLTAAGEEDAEVTGASNSGRNQGIEFRS